MPLTLIPFNDLVSQMSGELLANTTKVTNLTPGSIALALIKMVAAAGVSLQQLIAYIYSTERLATSEGDDAISFCADFALSPLVAAPSTGNLTLTRQITGAELLVKADGSSIVQTAVNQIQFKIIPDANQSAWDPVRGVYVFSSLQTSITVTVECLTAGAIGNITSGSLTQIVSGLTGVNTVSNAAAYTNGRDAETIDALKTRFPLYLQSLKTANTASIEAAIQGVQSNVSYQIIQYKHFDGTSFPAGFCAVVDDGTGNASTQFISAVQTAIDAVRAAGVQFEVYKPTNVTINVAVTLTYQTGVNSALVQIAVQNAIQQYVNSLGVGGLVSYPAIANAIQNTAGVYAYTGLTVNSGTSDVAISDTQLARYGTTTFN